MTRAREVASSGGLVLVSTTTFSTVASQSINNVFSATYDAYKIFIRYTAASVSTLSNLRLRVAGADDTNSVYGNRSFKYAVNTVDGYDNSNAATYNFGNHGTGNFTAIIDVNSPFLTHQTLFNGSALNIATAVLGGCAFTNTTSFTGFTIFPNSGTISGTISVYGYRK